MKLLLDVCVGGRLSNWLRDKGFDVKEVRELNKSMPDEEVVEWALTEDRIILTVDKDFGELSVAKGKKCSIIRLPDVSVDQRILLIELVLQRHFSKLKDNVIVTVSEKRIRIRYLDSQ